jgi:hypothetical protein
MGGGVCDGNDMRQEVKLSRSDWSGVAGDALNTAEDATND